MSALRRSIVKVMRLADPTPDAELVRRAAHRDEIAIELLIARHGPMVLRVCRHLLGDDHAAEDAFQAVFLMLWRRAGSLRRSDRLAAWLFGTARRIALKAKTSRSRRHRREVRRDVRPTDGPLDNLTARELLVALDEEIERLPELYRLPLLLVYWQGLAQSDAARRLGWSPGSVKGRLERGRKMLGVRLTNRGLAPSVLLAASATAVSVPSDLFAKTAALTASATIVPAGVAALAATGGGKVISVAVAALVVAAGTIGVAGGWAEQQKPKDKAKPAAAANPEVVVEAQPRVDRFGDPLPEGAVARLGTVRLRHSGAVSAAFLPDGNLGSFGSDATIRWWDLDSGRLLGIREFEAEPQVPGTWQFSADGRRVLFAEGVGKALVLCDSQNGKEIARLPRAQQMVSDVALAPNGRTVAFQDWNSKHLHLWDSETNRLRELDKADVPKQVYAFSPDSRRFAAGFQDRLVVWDVESGAELMDLKGIARPSGVAFDPAGEFVAVLSQSSNQSLAFYHVARGKRVDELKSPAGEFRWVQFHPREKLVLLGQDDQWMIWDPVSAKKVRTFSGSVHRGVVVAPGGKRVVSVGGTAIRVWDSATGQALHADLDSAGPGGEVSAVAISPDGATMATLADRELGFWDIATSSPTVRISWNGGFARQIRLTSNGDVLGPAADRVGLCRYGRDGTKLQEFDFDNSIGRHAAIASFRLGEDQRRLAALSQVIAADGESICLTFWSFSSGRRLAQHRLESGTTMWYGDFSPNLRCFAAQGSIWRLDGTPSKRDLGQAKNAHFPTVFSNDGRLFAVNLFETVRRKLPDGREWHGPHRTPGVAVFETASGRQIVHLDAGESGQLAFSPDGRELAAAGRDTIAIWDLSTGKRRVVWQSHLRGYGSFGPSSASSLAYSPDGRRLVTGHKDQTVLIREVPMSSRNSSRLSTSERDVAWTQLTGDDAAAAYQSVWKLADDHGAVEHCRKQLSPASPLDSEKLARWLSDLDSPSFAQREAAGKAIRALGQQVIAKLEDALASSRSAEVKNRIQVLIDDLRDNPTASELGQLRAVHVLEHVATPTARELLADLAKGAPGARLTEEAKASLSRLKSR